MSEIEELRKKLERKDMVIEELAERVESLKERVSDVGGSEINDLLMRLQDKHTEIKKLTAERKEQADQIERLGHMLKEVRSEHEEALKLVRMANLAISHCVEVLGAIYDQLGDVPAKRKVEDLLVVMDAEPPPKKQATSTHSGTQLEMFSTLSSGG